jgi:putative component of membrane protein insertase Oxa1/YidC/SpoIIIJ protein YidD
MSEQVNPMQLRGVITALILVLWLILPVQLSARDKMKGPFPGSEKAQLTDNRPVSTLKWAGKGAIRLFSRYISPADGPRSPSYPTSTAYGRDAIETHGFLVGVLLIADRLLHEADIHKGQKIVLYGTSRYYDPVENNTFWWK